MILNRAICSVVVVVVLIVVTSSIPVSVPVSQNVNELVSNGEFWMQTIDRGMSASEMEALDNYVEKHNELMMAGHDYKPSELLSLNPFAPPIGALYGLFAIAHLRYPKWERLTHLSPAGFLLPIIPVAFVAFPMFLGFSAGLVLAVVLHCLLPRGT